MKSIFFGLLFGISTSIFAVTSPTYLQTLTIPGPNGNLQLAVSSSGTAAIAVWTNFPNQIEIQAAYFDCCPTTPPKTDQWKYLTPAEFLPSFIPPTIALGSSPKAVIDQNGIATIVWVTPTNQIKVARYSKNILLNPGQSTTLTQPGTFNSAPTIAASQDGTVIVVWIQSAPYQVRCSSFIPAPGAQWTQPQPFPFMEIPVNNQGIPINTFGTYPAGIGLGNMIPSGSIKKNPGLMVWTDGASGAVRTGSFSIP